MSRDPNQEYEWANVKLVYEHNPHRALGNNDTINIRTPSERTPNGEISAGENFAVVEQKVATTLGGMLGKGLIRLEAKIRRGKPNVRVSLFVPRFFRFKLAMYVPLRFSFFFGSSSQSCNYNCWCIRPKAISWLLVTIYSSATCCWITQHHLTIMIAA
jgi:hypothetical protein